MSYDLRVDLDSNKAKLEIYSQVYQQTGEDWNEVKLLLSTAKPAPSVGYLTFRPGVLTK